MEAKFEVKMTQKIMFHFMMNHTYKSPTGILGILFGLSAFVLFGVTINNAQPWQSILYLLFGIWFILYLPVNLYLRSGKQVKGNPVFKKPITYLVNNEGITTMAADQQSHMKWDSLVKVEESKESLMIYTGKRTSFVWPKESIGNQYDMVIRMIGMYMDANKVKLKSGEAKQ